MATHSSIFTWEIPWTEEPGGQQLMAWSCKELDTTERLTLSERFACTLTFFRSLLKSHFLREVFLDNFTWNCSSGAFLVARWWRVCLPMQETRVRSLVWEDSTCWGATKLMCHNFRACVLEPGSCNYRAFVLPLLKPACPRAHALQQESSPHSSQLEKNPCSNEGPAQPKIHK